MKVKELIKILQQVENQDMNVVIKGADPTDFIYYNDIEETKESFLFQDRYDAFEVDDEEYAEERDVRISEVFIIDAGIF